MLNIRDAIKLYLLLSNSVPEEEMDIMDFIGTIIDNIKNSERPEAFGEAIMLMHNMDISELKDKQPYETIELFATGLADNKFVSLAAFCKSIGISNG